MQGRHALPHYAELPWRCRRLLQEPRQPSAVSLRIACHVCAHVTRSLWRRYGVLLHQHWIGVAVRRGHWPARVRHLAAAASAFAATSEPATDAALALAASTDSTAAKSAATVTPAIATPNAASTDAAATVTSADAAATNRAL